MKLNPGQTVTIGAKTYEKEIPDALGEKLGIVPPVETPVEDPEVTVDFVEVKKKAKKK